MPKVRPTPKMGELGLIKQSGSACRYDKNPVSSHEIMNALDWQVSHPTHFLAMESAETVAKALRERNLNGVSHLRK
jgi:hypothetical protein